METNEFIQQLEQMQNEAKRYREAEQKAAMFEQRLKDIWDILNGQEFELVNETEPQKEPQARKKQPVLRIARKYHKLPEGVKNEALALADLARKEGQLITMELIKYRNPTLTLGYHVAIWNIIRHMKGFERGNAKNRRWLFARVSEK
jgi:hypothetical protein